MITAEKGDGALTRHGIEEYVSDCVILLDNRVEDQTATRRLQLVKYRGSAHGGDEYPFLIDQTGLSVLPITSLSLDHPVSEVRISAGVKRLDVMLGGKGYFKGSTILISGTSGTGKTSLSVSAVDAACRRGEKCLYLAFEESPEQIIRNMKSVGFDLGKWIKKGLLRFFANRPTSCGLEMHLLAMHKAVDDFQPDLVVADPISSLMKAGSGTNTPFMVLRLIDFLKSKSITVILSSLTQGGSALEATNVEISSLVDTWILLRDIEIGGERNRGLYVLKSRGMDHSNQIREFKLTNHGLDLLDVYTGPEGVLTGSARIAQEAREKAQAVLRKQDLRRKRADLEKRHSALKAQMEALRAESASLKDEMEALTANEELREKEQTSGRAALASARRAD